MTSSANGRQSFLDQRADRRAGELAADQARPPATRRTFPRTLGRKLPAPARGTLTKLAIALALCVVLFAVVGFFVVPPLAKHYLVEGLSEQLGRRVTIADIDFNPFAMAGAVEGIAVYEPNGTELFASIEALSVNLEYRSIIRRAPVLKRVGVSKPYLHVVRFEDGKTYNFSDLLTKFTAAPKPSEPQGEPLRFALNNIELRAGRIDFDDRPVPAKHAVTDINAAIPFISNLPYLVDEYVQPAFSAKVNGTPVALTGRTKPFKDSLEASLDLDVNRLELPRYVPYIPLELKFKLPSGLLSTDLSLAFVRGKTQAPLLRLYGSARIENLALAELTGEPLLKLASLEVPIQSVDVFGQRYALGVIAVRSPEVFVRRNADGQLNWLSVMPQSADGNQGEGKLQLAIAELALSDGRLHFVDRVPPKGFRADLTGIRVSVTKFAMPQQQPALVDAALQTGFGEGVTLNGSLVLTPLASEGNVTASNVRLAKYTPYYADLIRYELQQGIAEVSSRYSLRQAPEGMQASLSQLNLGLQSLRLRKRGERQDFLRVKTAQISDGAVDVNRLLLTVGGFSTSDGFLNVIRESDGALNVTRILPAPPDAAPTPGKATPWQITLDRAQVDRWKVAFTDLALAQPVKLSAEAIRVRATGLSNQTNRRGQISLQAKLDENGSIAVRGPITLAPVRAALDVDLQGFALVPLQPYFTEQLTILLTSGDAAVKGNARIALAQDGALAATFNGDVQLASFASVDKALQEDFLRWDNLFVGQIAYVHSPMSMSVEEISLSDFFSRIIIHPDGHLNLQDIRAAAAEQPPAAEGGQAVQAAAPAQAGGEEVAVPPVRVAKVTLQGGEIDFTDLFVKPNYRADLTEIAGSVVGLSSQLDTAADVELHGRFAKTAPVEIKGKVNPLLRNLYLDIGANVRDIELGPFSPYSGKYVGYAIEKGKMSFDVAYKIENRKLNAQNKLVLNQLTFGDKVESPDATKLPVLLAVSLLKDRNGVIDVNLPISGSVDDPKFSVGRIVITIIFNLIEKAVTAPFALIGSLFGGGGEELSYVEFDHGLAALSQASQDKLTKLQTALVERPGLKLDIAGYADTQADREGLRRHKFEQQVKAQKRKQLVKDRASVQTIDEVQIDPAEYEKYLKRAYREAKFPKPRNVVGFIKNLPREEMEKLMLTNTQVTDEDLTQLANGRAQSAKDFITREDKVSVERVFLLAPKVSDGAGDDEAKGGRAVFTLK
jgi:uncharacterized protein involved in outer membrane biogenesis